MKILTKTILGKNTHKQEVGMIRLETANGIIETPYYFCHGIHVAGFIKKIRINSILYKLVQSKTIIQIVLAN